MRDSEVSQDYQFLGYRISYGVTGGVVLGNSRAEAIALSALLEPL